MTATNTMHTPVLIVGGGPVGLALALELAYQGVHSTLVERDAGTGIELLAKAGTLNERSSEFFRRWGVTEEVANWGADENYPRDTCYVTSLNGYLVGRDKVAPAKVGQAQRSPEILRKCPQHILDPLLARAVAARGLTDVHYSTESRSIGQDADGVTVELFDTQLQRTWELRADYVVGCDGAASATRRAAGVSFDGRTLDYSVSAMIRIRDLDEYHPIGRASRYMFVGRDGNWANLTSVDHGGDLWRFTLFGSEERISPDQIDVRARVEEAFGRKDIPFEMLRALPWRRSQSSAGTYASGRILFAGDAAHTMSNTGGHGLNTGLGDVIGLGWILAALVQGWGAPGLLGAYDAERRPVGVRNGAASTRNYEGWMGAGIDFSHVLDEGPDGDAARAEIGRRMSQALYGEWHSHGIGLGYRYEHSPAIVPDATPEPPDDAVNYVPTARPGHRAPHAWLSEGHSVIDLFGHGFTLLRFGQDGPDVASIADAARERGVPLTVQTIEDPEIAALYERALVLVRPDGHVAWRADTVPPDALELIDRVRGARPDSSELIDESAAGALSG